MNVIRLMLFMFFVLLCGCGAPSYHLTLTASDKLNNTSQDRSLPVLVKVYQLSEKEVFETASFRQIWKHDKSTLGETFVSAKEITVAPHSKTKVQLKRNKEARFVAIAALFREPEVDHWRIVKKIPSRVIAQLTSLQFTLDSNRLGVS